MVATRPFPPAPMLLAASSSAPRPRAMIATSAPEAANRVAIASPMPLLPPVMTAVRPARLISIPSSRWRPEGRAHHNVTRAKSLQIESRFRFAVLRQTDSGWLASHSLLDVRYPRFKSPRRRAAMGRACDCSGVVPSRVMSRVTSLGASFGASLGKSHETARGDRLHLVDPGLRGLAPGAGGD